MNVLILGTQEGDWEGLFIDGKLIDEGHTLGGPLFMLKMSEEHGFKYSDVISVEINDKDEEHMMSWGSFPENINELNGNY